MDHEIQVHKKCNDTFESKNFWFCRERKDLKEPVAEMR
jgi:hypothetical protein